MNAVSLRIVVNGVGHEIEVPVEWRLIDVLRDGLGLVGTKEGCSIGVCGLCTVIIDGELMSACLVPAVSTAGAVVETIEGLAANGQLTPLQDAFIRCGGFQCGICTPGQLMAATALLRTSADPSDDEIRRWMMGNLCRCTGYEGILVAIRSAASTSELTA